MRELSAYPQLIAQSAISLNEIEAEIIPLRRSMEAIEAEIDSEVATDANLKNDTQRKATKREYLQASKPYQAALLKLDALLRDRAIASTRLEQLRNEFSVVKLDARLKIAQMLVAVDSRELAGL